MLLRVLVAAATPSLARRVVRVVTSLDVSAHSTGLGDALVEQARLEAADLVMLASPSSEQAMPHLEALRGTQDPPEVLLLTGSSDDESMASAVALGALGVLALELAPADLRTALEPLMARALTLRAARERPPDTPAGTDDLIVESASMRRVIDLATRAAQSTSTVLVTGETGVGKERVAQLVHARSPRAAGPFVALNCAAIPAQLVESELFGHVRGAFTGAVQARRGTFELAHGGTLLLDEVGELPLQAQAKLLRVLQDRKSRAVGSERATTVDVRVIAATNRPLEAEVEAGRFRADLYYRLSVIELEVPPLRDRRPDIQPMLRAQLERFNEAFGRTLTGYSAPAWEALEAYRWPGNVRELINIVERAVLLCAGQQIELSDLPQTIARGSSTLQPGAPAPAPLPATPKGPAPSDGLGIPAAWLELPWRELRERLLSDGERSYLIQLLTATEGRVGQAARRAGMAERSLFEKMKRHGLRKEDFRFRDPSSESEPPIGGG